MPNDKIDIQMLIAVAERAFASANDDGLVGRRAMYLVRLYGGIEALVRQQDEAAANRLAELFDLSVV